MPWHFWGVYLIYSSKNSFKKAYSHTLHLLLFYGMLDFIWSPFNEASWNLHLHCVVNIISINVCPNFTTFYCLSLKEGTLCSSPNFKSVKQYLNYFTFHQFFNMTKESILVNVEGRLELCLYSSFLVFLIFLVSVVFVISFYVFWVSTLTWIWNHLLNAFCQIREDLKKSYSENFFLHC